MASSPFAKHEESKSDKEGFHIPKSPRRPPFLIPSPIPCRRTRTSSQSRMAADSPVQTGTVTEFSRSHGHGFVKPDEESDEKHYFVHISDVESEYELKEGDKVEFRTILMPPKLTEKQAVEVKLLKMSNSKHEKWASFT
ncbi:cold shock domain-containing protein C2-like [Rhopilema esculentum]|uniref:cold shock domain-containing protein C2-like n=1 Tax=Rhopilema esculentum TaxID=499914 RepID=UPI0031D73B95|eukprot:gene8923-16549_t